MSNKILVAVFAVVAVAIGLFVAVREKVDVASRDEAAESHASEVVTPATTEHTPATIDQTTVSRLSDAKLIGPLADAYRRIDPSQDGWSSEAFSEAATSQLTKLSHLLEQPDKINDIDFAKLATSDFACGELRPASREVVFEDEALVVARASRIATQPTKKLGIATAIRGLTAAFTNGSHLHTKLKLFQVNPNVDSVETTIYAQLDGSSDAGKLQINSTWRCRWIVDGNQPPKLTSIAVDEHDESLYRSSSENMFSDCTEAVLGSNSSYREQLLRSTDHWRNRIARDLGLDVVANHGMALGDVNGDGLEDLYVCQQGGLPNRLYLRNPNGTLTDATESSAADWLEYSASALLVDLDNDGDRDLVVAQEFRVLVMANDGSGHFLLEFGISTKAQAFSLSAADYDLDGDLDVFVCGYNPSSLRVRQGAMGEPMPYHDANNGGQNMLLENRGNWLFADVTDSVGLSENNTRYSFAAAWEDFDNDNDLDLYVSNDYGRNNLYRNEGGMFDDVAAELGVEDMSAGMSVSWADFNRDGWMDLYVSNMFSAAGNRITYQRQFKDKSEEQIRKQYQRHARGNSLFENEGGTGFRDVSVAAGVTMGRWAWGSRFVDLNNDGWEDIVVANGFITAEDSGDL